ncbi:putative nucleotide-binding protein [Pseudomonas migulae]|uniref:TIR domain-containing protein n=1 Tax=Pseudomonas migulae TaxID=78543 RepID=UPI00209FD4B7|nr:TIR domain-containing protein [Pseudomonas migulae]MCP1516924.1 putative nucleotide-binding protein [Pseudomonas migulae]
MIERFEGIEGRRRRIQALRTQKIVAGNIQLADELSDLIELRQLNIGETLIDQGGSDNDIYLIIAGRLEIIVNGRIIAQRTANDHVGEMAAIDPAQPRTAKVQASEVSLVGKLTEETFTKLAEKYSEMYKCIALELMRRLYERNKLIRPVHEKIRIFIICSIEAIQIARAVVNALQYDPFDVILWSEGVFKVTNYTLQTLEDEVDNSDFAIAIAHADDFVAVRENEWPAPRDNVIFELGLFMGRLGRRRAILMEPRAEKVKLPSDLAGVTTISYKFTPGGDAGASIAPACNALRDHINTLGAFEN